MNPKKAVNNMLLERVVGLIFNLVCFVIMLLFTWIVWTNTESRPDMQILLTSAMVGLCFLQIANLIVVFMPRR